MSTTTDRDPLNGEGQIYSYGVASGVNLPAGTLTQLGPSGYLLAADINSGLSAGVNIYAGVLLDRANNSSTNTAIRTVTGGGLLARVAKKGVFRFKSNVTPVPTTLGVDAKVIDNDTVGTSSAGGVAGTILGNGTLPYNYYDILIDQAVN